MKGSRELYSSIAGKETPHPEAETYSLEDLETLSEEPTKVSDLSLEDAEELREIILKLPEYQNYQKQKINFTTLNSLIDDYNHMAVSQATDNPTIFERSRQSLGKMIEDVKRSVDSYYRAILSIERSMRLQKFRMDPRDYAEEFSRHDGYRRSIHNALLANLTSLTRFSLRTIPERLGISLPKEKFFNQYELHNRDFIGDWAYKIAQGARIQEVLKTVERKIKKEEKAEATQ